jgi:phosphomannomutase/phosphoglucomutase
MKFKINPNIFLAYDIRGVYNKDLTGKIALNIGKALGSLLKGKGTICVGFDTRPSSPTLFENLISGLVSTGCKVIPIRMAPNGVSFTKEMK